MSFLLSSVGRFDDKPTKNNFNFVSAQKVYKNDCLHKHLHLESATLLWAPTSRFPNVVQTILN